MPRGELLLLSCAPRDVTSADFASVSGRAVTVLRCAARVGVAVLLVAKSAAAQEANSNGVRRLSISPEIAWHNDGSPDGLDAGALLSTRVHVPIGDRVTLEPEILLGTFISRSDLCTRPEGCGEKGTAAVAAFLVGIGRTLNAERSASMGLAAGYYRAFGGRGRADGEFGVSASLARRLGRGVRNPELTVSYHLMLDRLQTTYGFLPIGLRFRF